MKLIVASTFREFDGSENDRIQRVFLEGLKNLKHTDLELVVTTFGERTVKKTIEESGLKNVVFEEETKDYRFSLTNVLLNALLYQLFLLLNCIVF